MYFSAPAAAAAASLLVFSSALFFASAICFAFSSGSSECFFPGGIDLGATGGSSVPPARALLPPSPRAGDWAPVPGFPSAPFSPLASFGTHLSPTNPPMFLESADAAIMASICSLLFPFTDFPCMPDDDAAAAEPPVFDPPELLLEPPEPLSFEPPFEP